MAASQAALAAGLDALASEQLLRTRRVLESPQGPRVRVDGVALVNFSSNDYLGLASDPRLARAAHDAIDRWGVGSGASALVSGHLAVHEAAEKRFAGFIGVERALLFGSGYLANLGILGALADRHAQVFSDRLNHACLIDGARLSRAQVTRYPHCDVDTLAAALAASNAKTKVIATDTVFSMDGDIAPLERLLQLAERHDAWLVLDDAHGIGVLGAAGRGALDLFPIRSPRVIVMATLGKALGGYGAFVGGSALAIAWLEQRARTYVFSTSLPPMAAAVAHAAIDLLEAEPARVSQLRERVDLFRHECAKHGIESTTRHPTSIRPFMTGTAERALGISAALAAGGYWVPAIRPPTVPEGTSRLRVSFSAAHTREEVAGLAKALARALAP